MYSWDEWFFAIFLVLPGKYNAKYNAKIISILIMYSFFLNKNIKKKLEVKIDWIYSFILVFKKLK